MGAPFIWNLSLILWNEEKWRVLLFFKNFSRELVRASGRHFISHYFLSHEIPEVYPAGFRVFTELQDIISTFLHTARSEGHDIVYGGKWMWHEILDLYYRHRRWLLHGGELFLHFACSLFLLLPVLLLRYEVSDWWHRGDQDSLHFRQNSYEIYPNSATVFCIARTIDTRPSVHEWDLNSSGVCSRALSRLSRMVRNLSIVLFSDHSVIWACSSRLLRTRLL
jgi:hypothetical protein